ncbi:hypothetical protein L228DRAFT_251497 [Xylona heveae TC161]|uniref:Mediator of RNA polymerase II transcription subunit 1 n=1 Tax=Xylona heveae (strain CBS 132557 / TC161) TaxID=1328760 RepID=A0A164ZDC8_XYLHT|nr:hypothetical protein L228DRAFT_251497 [Xylona heveae TC161]KZF18960.1 hypothetical protein L228DRAFT_251497 [Xylona heveae TC161]
MATPTPGQGLPGSNKHPPLQASGASGLTPSSLGSQQHLSAFSSPFPSHAGKTAPSPATAHASIAGGAGAGKSVPSPAYPSGHPSTGGKSAPSPAGMTAHPSLGGKSAPSPANLSAYPSIGGKSAPSPASHFAQRGHKHATSTPNAAALTFDSPSAAASLGLNLAGIGTPSGMGGLVNARSDEEERARRIEAILQLLRSRPGRVSEEAVERLAKRTGLDCLWEEKTLSIAGSALLVDLDFQNHIVDRVSLSLPGSSDAVSVHAPKASAILYKDLKPEDGSSSPINTTLNKFADNLERLAKLDKLSTPEVNCFEAIAGVYTSLRRIFEHEKKQSGQEAGEKMNPDEEVERLVMCEKSGRPRMHAGKRVGLALEYWMDRRRVSTSRKRKAESGSDEMDIDSIEKSRNKAHDGTSYDGNIWSAIIECEHSPAELYTPIRISNDWVSQRIERPSEEQDELFGPDGPTIDWTEPAPTFVSGPAATRTPGAASSSAPDPMDTSGQNMSKLPDVRFVARLEPPVVVPLQKAVEIYDSVGLVIPQESIQPTTLDGLILPPDPSEVHGAVHGEARYLSNSREVLGFDGSGKEQLNRHDYALFAHKLDFGRVVDEIPFRHPMELINILPILRQYALTTTLLKRSFEGGKGSNWSATGNATLGATGSLSGSSGLPSTQQQQSTNARLQLSPEDELAALLDGESPLDAPSALPSSSPSHLSRSDPKSAVPSASLNNNSVAATRHLSIDVGLSMQPHPNFTLAFSIPVAIPPPPPPPSPPSPAPTRAISERLAYVHLNVLPDAVIRASYSSGADSAPSSRAIKKDSEAEADKKSEETTSSSSPKPSRPLVSDDEITRVCSVAEDFGILVEYIRWKAHQVSLS